MITVDKESQHSRNILVERDRKVSQHVCIMVDN